MRPVRSCCWRCQMAISRASSASSACNEFETRQPTMDRLNTSITNATYTKPVQVLTYVRSETHNRFGAEAVKLRSTRSAGRGLSSSGIVVRFFLPRTTPLRSRSSISLATRSRPILWVFPVELTPDLLNAVHVEVVAVHPPDLTLQLLVTQLTR